MATVEHSGTIYFLTQLEKQLGPIRFQHCIPNTLAVAKNKTKLYTAYRDPYRVAASWYNRGKLQTVDDYEKWSSQWQIYWRFRDLNPTVFDVSKGNNQHGFRFNGLPKNAHKDTHGLHFALDSNDLDYFHTHIPKILIDAANSASG